MFMSRLMKTLVFFVSLAKVKDIFCVSISIKCFVANDGLCRHFYSILQTPQ